MKPLGPIPAGFEAIDGELAIGDRPVSELVAAAGRTPLFVYSRERIAQRFAELRAAMPDRLKINYAIKADSFSPLLEYVSNLADGLDIASGGELETSMRGIPRSCHSAAYGVSRKFSRLFRVLSPSSFAAHRLSP